MEPIFAEDVDISQETMNGAILENYATAEIIKSYENSGKDIYA